MVGKLVSHYRILEKLGEGGMGVVYKAEDTRLKRVVALKFLTASAVGSEQEKTRFVHEAQAAAALDHPNICTVYEIGEAEGKTPQERGRLFIAMAYIEGQNLKEKIEKNLPKVQNLREVLNLAIQISEGLQAAHESGIIHRDMKCDNVMVTEKGFARIMDFGLAKLSGRTQVTREGMTLGTVSYMSPEQAQGEEVDHRTDIWSFGVMLYEMVSGQLPFKGDYEQAVIYSIMNEDPEPLTGLRTDVSMELERIVHKCLEKEPANRYQHMDELLVDLSRVKKGQGSQGVVTKSNFRTKIPKKHTSLIVSSVLILGAFILTVIGYFFFAPDTKQPVAARKMLLVLPFENLGPAEEQYFADGITEEITSRLALVKGLGIISRTSAVQYAKTDKSMKQIGEELGVGFVLEGSVRWARTAGGSDRVRITPQLIRSQDDTHLWANNYDRIIDDIFEIQSDIAQEVVTQLGISLLEPERLAAKIKPTENLDAYHAFLRGRYYERQPHFSIENWKRVVQNYQTAVELDSNFALAYAELSKAHSRLYFLRYDLSDERREMARLAARRALELAPDSPEVHLILSYYYLWSYRNIQKTLEELSIAEQERPNNPEIFRTKADIFELQGRWEQALKYLKKAFELSPRDASFPTEMAWIFWTTRRYQQAIEACDQAIDLAPDAVWPYLYKTFTYWFWKGATEEAKVALEFVPKNHSWAPWAWFWQEIFEGNYRQAIERLSLTSGDWIRLKMWARPKSWFRAFAYDLMDEPELAHASYDSARSMLEEEVEKWQADPRLHSSLGMTYAALGRSDEAIREGKRAVELLPISKDAFYGLPYLQDLAHIYVLTQKYQAAIDQLEYLLSIPSWFTVAWLKLDPRWNPLRNHPRFQRLLDKYSKING